MILGRVPLGQPGADSRARKSALSGRSDADTTMTCFADRFRRDCTSGGSTKRTLAVTSVGGHSGPHELAWIGTTPPSPPRRSPPSAPGSTLCSSPTCSSSAEPRQRLDSTSESGVHAATAAAEGEGDAPFAWGAVTGVRGPLAAAQRGRDVARAGGTRRCDAGARWCSPGPGTAATDQRYRLRRRRSLPVGRSAPNIHCHRTPRRTSTRDRGS